MFILNRLESSLFLLTLNSKSTKKRKIEAYEKLKKIYPSTFSIKDILLIKNKDGNDYLCYLNIKINSGTKLLLPELFILNHYKKDTGCIFVETSQFCEEIEIEKGKILKVKLKQKIVKTLDKNYILLTEENLKEKCLKNDYISKNSKKQLLGKIIISISIISLFFCVGIYFSKYYFERYQEELLDKIEVEEKNKIKLEQQKKLEQELKDKEKIYYELYINKNQKIYNLINIIYNNVGRDSIIKSLNIEKNMFNLEIITKDSMKILSNFEMDNNVNQIQMTKTSIQDNAEFVTYIGKFKIYIEHPSENLSVQEKIKFYEEKIQKEEDRLDSMKNMKLSVYADNIRKLLHENNCLESYLQYRKNKNIALLVCLFKSNSENVFNFLKNVQLNNSIEIYSLNLNNNNNDLEALIKFYSGIDISDKLNNFTGMLSDEKIVEPNELGSIFKHKNTNVLNQQTQQHTLQKKEKEIDINFPEKKETKEIPILKSKNLSYVGKVKIGNTTTIVIKKTDENILYHLPVVSDIHKTDKDCCFINNNIFYVKIDNNIYEVRK